MKLEDPVKCKDIVTKGIGQMFRRSPVPMVFCFDKEQKVPLHMLFVFFPLDIAYLNEKYEVVELKENLRPFRWYVPEHKARYVVELPAGTISEERLRIGNKIIFS